MRQAIAVFLLALASAVPLAGPAQASPSEYDFEAVSATLSDTQAGAHPDFTTSIEFKQDPSREPEGNGLRPLYAQTRDIFVNLPPGLIGNPNVLTQCSAARFADVDTGCPFSSQVGIAVVDTTNFELGLTEPIYLLTPPVDGVARLAFWAGLFPFYINVEVRSEDDYGVTAAVEGIPGVAETVRTVATLWGVPADKSHDTQRLTPAEAGAGLKKSPARSSGLALLPFTSNPTSCGSLTVGFEADSYQLPGQFVKANAELGPITGCEALDFAPSFTATPTTRRAAAPSGLEAELSIPQVETVNSFATAQLRNAIVKLPEGMTVAAGAADGLQACSDAQAAYKTREPSKCPDAAKLGEVEIDVPALSRPVQGALYQRSPEPGNLFRVWLIGDELGAHVKIPGELRLDPRTGQLTSLFLDSPQVSFRSLRLHVKGGSRGPLATPSACGIHQTHFEFAPWSGNPTVSGDAPMTIDEGCGTGGFSPKLSAGSVNTAAGAFSAFVTELTRESGEQNISALEVTLPPGVLAKLAGVGLCEGAAAQSGDCPPSSRVGALAVASGPGASPLWIPQPGKEPTAIYLSGPYDSAPYSLVIKVPAQAGPFDLGDVISRAGIYLDPTTAQATIKSDPLPQILEGVPISYRTIHAEVDRENFTLNPTSCDRMQAKATLTSALGVVAVAVSPFQVGGCGDLRFKPKLSMRLKGKTNRGAHPGFTAILRARAGDANIARAEVSLPRSEFLDQAHIRTICTRVQFAGDRCPAGSVYGHATATTPLLDRPLKGPVYLRSSNHSLPDLVVALNGQVDFDLVGRIDSVKGGIRTTFENAPDAPVTKFVLRMQGGKKGLLVNSRNLCKAPSHVAVELDGHNGKTADQSPLLQNDCAKSARRQPKAH